MPRKPKVRSRHSDSGAGSASSAGPSGLTSRRAAPRRRSEPPIFWQCQSCGAPVEPQFGAGDDSWCPSCHSMGTVVGMEEQYPTPALYGNWAAQQVHNKEQEQAEAELMELVRLQRSITKEETVKRTKTHSGTFHCPTCFTEVELFNEESLKCDKCKGPLAAGGLDEIWADDDEDEA
jgi:Zn finger protein HypA/HybF involved in hydrogenase expression